jgi:hypothetical protein
MVLIFVQMKLWRRAVIVLVLSHQVANQVDLKLAHARVEPNLFLTPGPFVFEDQFVFDAKICGHAGNIDTCYILFPEKVTQARGYRQKRESALGETRTPMGYPTRTSSVRVCHFATSAGRGRISLEPNLSLKFNVEKWRGVRRGRAGFGSPRSYVRLVWPLLNDQ